MDQNLVLTLFLIFSGAALLATVALLTRQSMLVAYIILGVMIGPSGFGLLENAHLIRDIGNIGIIFLLFLLGLHLPPQKLMHMLRKISWVGLLSSLGFAFLGYMVAYIKGYTPWECAVVGAAMMFSSTIIGIKLLPTTILHHQHTGEVMISVLLFQDIIAIFVLLGMHAVTGGGLSYHELLMVVVGFPGLIVVSYLFERFVLRVLFVRFNRIREYLFLLAIGWCLCLAQCSEWLGLSAEIGAFIAGVTLAASPVSVYIAESLRPVRDFFLVMFFFSVGASFNLSYLSDVILPSLILLLLLMVAKPTLYYTLLRRVGEVKSVSWEVGVRLAQVSEFSLIIAYLGLDTQLISHSAAYLIEATTILSFVLSSYWVVMRFPTPVATSDRLRRD